MALVLSGTFVLPAAGLKTKKTMETDVQATTATSGFYSFKMKTLDNKTIDFSKYKGKKVLLVNTASECGYTPQYAELQKLHETHGKDVFILGFPANNFGEQESGTDEQIASFCQKNFGVTFQMFSKVSVIGADRTPLYTWLEKNAPNHDKPSWNFCKYLVDEKGKVVGFYPSKVKPMSEELLAAIKK
ncbi:glutathione peroxidase [Pontibacter arcticus]|uniref:Glutathione peroxidase n=2 Tax=Pontibacter arcticus TaxID=2080288 RepID=A0A364RCJ0_9BACT|nr:glutathione peroxidase [Pontibacter arcticus]